MNQTTDGAGYSFPVLKAQQIVECLQDLSIPMTEEMMMQPETNREGVIRVFERLVEATTCMTREEMSQPVFAGLSVLNYAELHEESIPEMAFYRACARMMEVSCVHDFCFKDLQHPNKHRLRRHLSAVINFCKFREERMMVYNELSHVKEQKAAQLVTLQEGNVKLEKELAAHTEQTAGEQKIIEEVEADCQSVEAALAHLNRQQAELRLEISDLKKLSNDQRDRANTLSLDLQEAQQEREKLRGQVVNSPHRIRREMADQQQALEQEHAEGMSTEKDAQRMDMCVANVSRAEKDVLKAIKAIEEVDAEMAKFKDAAKELKSTQTTLAANRASAAEAQGHVQNLNRQLNRYEDKLGHLRRQAKLKSDNASETMETLHREMQEVDRGRREAMAQLESVELEVQRLEQEQQAERARQERERRDMLDAYRRMEGVVLQHQQALRTVLKPLDYPMPALIA